MSPRSPRRQKKALGQKSQRPSRQRERPLHAATRLKREAFLAAYAQLGNITAAAKAAGIERKTHYLWLRDRRYKRAAEEAEAQATERMEQEAWRRAVVGADKPVYWRGVKVDTVKEYSDVLLIFLLKARRPERYRERYEHSGPGGGPIPAEVSFYLPRNMRDDGGRPISG